MAAKTVVRVTPGFEVVGEAESGEDAVAQVDALHPSLVLMDINMPGINGIEASRRIHAAHPDVCVVLLSTYTADDLPADALTSGAAAYINKDEFGPQVLRSTWDGSSHGAARSCSGSEARRRHRRCLRHRHAARALGA